MCVCVCVCVFVCVCVCVYVLNCSMLCYVDVVYSLTGIRLQVCGWVHQGYTLYSRVNSVIGVGVGRFISACNSTHFI